MQHQLLVATVIDVRHLGATFWRSSMKKTVDASIIAVASQKDTATISVSSMYPSPAIFALTFPKAKRPRVPIKAGLMFSSDLI